MLFIIVIVVIAAANYAFRHSNGHDVHFSGARDISLAITG